MKRLTRRKRCFISTQWNQAAFCRCDTGERAEWIPADDPRIQICRRDTQYESDIFKEEIMTKNNTQLQQDVLQELEYEPSVNSSAIGVTAKDVIVGLTGNVKSYAEKNAAVHAAERVAGVKAVTDEMKVDLPAFHVRNDEDIARAAVNALQWDVWVPTDVIKMKVNSGRITLEGEVNFKYQQTAAENAVRNLTGVKGVSNLINIKKPAVVPSEVKVQIDNALRRAAEVDSGNIKVNVVSDKVILRGKVSSWAERKEAERAAWSAPGVRTVEDDLVIAA
jgi:osmotically-inducible protein OsmY